jgi:hypothetical protein
MGAHDQVIFLQGPDFVERNRGRLNLSSTVLNPKRPPKIDWRAFDAMSEEERHEPRLPIKTRSLRPRRSLRMRGPSHDPFFVVRLKP